MTRLIRSMCFFTVVILFGFPSFGMSSPELFFSDLESGPKTGWEGSADRGAAKKRNIRPRQDKRRVAIAFESRPANKNPLPSLDPVIGIDTTVRSSNNKSEPAECSGAERSRRAEVSP